MQVKGVFFAIHVDGDFIAIRRIQALQATVGLGLLNEIGQRFLIGDGVGAVLEHHAIGRERIAVATVGGEVDGGEGEGVAVVDHSAVVDQHGAVVQYNTADSIAGADIGCNRATRGTAAVVGHFHAGNLGKAAVVAAGRVGADNGMLQDVLQLGGVHRRGAFDQVGEGQDVEGVTQGHVACTRNASADAAAVLDGDVGLAGKTHGVSNQIAHASFGVAYAFVPHAGCGRRHRGAASVGGAIELGSGGTDYLGVEGGNIGQHRGHHIGVQGGVGGHLVGIGGSARDADHLGGIQAGDGTGDVVDGEREFAHVAVAEVAGDYGHLLVVKVSGVDGVGVESGGDHRSAKAQDVRVIRVRHQLVAATGDNQIHTFEAGYHGEFVAGALQVRHDDNHCHAFVIAQAVDLGLDQRNHGSQVLCLGVQRVPVLHDAGGRRGNAGQTRGGCANDTDFLAAGGGDDLGRRNLAGKLQCVEFRGDTKVQIH